MFHSENHTAYGGIKLPVLQQASPPMILQELPPGRKVAHNLVMDFVDGALYASFSDGGAVSQCAHGRFKL